MPKILSKSRLPQFCGELVGEVLKFHKHQHDFHAARRLRFCAHCKKIGTPKIGTLQCPNCQDTHLTNATFPRCYSSLHLRAGRRGGKSAAGAYAVLEELMVPNTNWWICAPTFPMLNDAAQKAFVQRLPPEWVARWSAENREIQLTNGSSVCFRSLDDPERARGQGLHGVWIDEAAFATQRAYDVLSPSLTDNLGVTLTTTSPAGFDWTYKEFYLRSKPGPDQEPGYWARKYVTLDNPHYDDPVHRATIEKKRRTTDAVTFAAEYLAEDMNFEGSVYDTQTILDQTLVDDAAIQKFIPEWPKINPDRQIIVGLDHGADHPFGAVKIVVTEYGLVVVAEYLERMQAAVIHLTSITDRFRLTQHRDIRWVANKNEAQLRTEFAFRGIGIQAAENKHKIGIERVKSWLFTKQLYFAHTVPKTLEQMRSYRWAKNETKDQQKRDEEQVFKKDDELPDAIRYAVMAWPRLPEPQVAAMTTDERDRWNALDDRTKVDIERVREFNKAALGDHLPPTDATYPYGNFYAHTGERDW